MSENKRTSFLLLCLVVALSLAALVFGSGILTSGHKGNQNPPPEKASRSIELAPESSRVWTQKQVLDESGRVTQIIFQLRDGGRAQAYLRGDGTTRAYSESRADGSLRVQLQLALDGKTIIEGYIQRADGSMQLLAHTQADGTILRTTYWRDGSTIFSRETQALQGADTRLHTTYYRADGTKWVLQVRAPGAATPVEETAFDLKGNALYTHSLDSTGQKAAVTYFRANGTASLVQHWATRYTYSGHGGEYDDYGYGGGGYSSSLEWYLDTVDELAPDGTTLKRTLSLSGSPAKVTAVTLPAPEGSTVKSLDDSFRVIKVEKRDGTGKVLETKSVEPGKPLTFREGYATPRPGFVEPLKEWKALEKQAAPATVTP